MNRTENKHGALGDRERGSLMERISDARSKLLDAPDEPAKAPMLSVDHPKKRERIFHPEYTFRVETPSPEPVEVSIDGEDWKACRPSVGYWWYDWSDYGTGLHQAVFRLRPRGREKTPTATCLVRVELPGTKE
ncbi:MAG: hypothetical protein ACHQ49_08185 [Elusimicrobiota bacterium]